MKILLSGEVENCFEPDITFYLAFGQVKGITNNRIGEDKAVVVFADDLYLVDRIDKIFFVTDEGKLLYRGDKIWQPNYLAAEDQGLMQIDL